MRGGSSGGGRGRVDGRNSRSSSLGWAAPIRWLFVQGDGPVLPGFDRSLAGIDQARRRRVSPPVSLPSSWTTPSDTEQKKLEIFVTFVF